MGDVILLIVVILLILMLVGVFPPKSQTPVRRGRAPRPVQQPARGTPAAQMAMRRAGYAAGDEYAQVTDIGLLAYRGAEDPRLVRQNAVGTDTDYLRPFVGLWVPHDARGMVRFEIVDNQGRLRYADEMRYDLRRGENTLLPGTWLPLRGKTIVPEPWEMRVSVGETPLAVYSFGWQRVGGSELQRYIATDGEISPELQQALRQQASQAMSLSDLLNQKD